MQKILRSPASIRRKVVNKVFAVPLKELCRFTSTGVRIPEILQKVTDFIQMHGIGHEGIFRINGSSKIVDKLRLQYDRHGNANLEEAGDVMAVASLLKLFFRELPEPVVVPQLHAQFLTVQEELQYNKEESLKQLKNLLQQLPEENLTVLIFLCRFLRKVTHFEDTNKMNSMALAIVFGPNLFRCADGIQGLREQGQTNHLVRLFLDKFEFLFGVECGGYSPPPSVALPGAGQVWSSKRIEVQAAKEKKSPPIIPMMLAEQHLRLKKVKQLSQEEVDLNSNYSGPSKDNSSPGSPRNHHGYLSTPDGDFDDRALSPFNLDSDLGTSAAPSPVASAVTSEVVERTIQESISQHLFGAQGSPPNNLSPRLHDGPVAMPRKKHQKKTQDGASAFNRRSNSESSLERLVKSIEESDNLSIRTRLKQFKDDTMVTNGSHDHEGRTRKGRPASKAFDFFESQGIIIGQKTMDSTYNEGITRDDTFADVTQDESLELDNVKRNSGTLNSLTSGRAAPPNRRSPTKKNAKDKNSGDSPDSSNNHREKNAKRTNNGEGRPQSQEVWLRKNGEGQRSPPGARNVRDGGLWGVQAPHNEPQENSREQPVPQPRQRRRKAKEEEEDARRRLMMLKQQEGYHANGDGKANGEGRKAKERGPHGNEKQRETNNGREDAGLMMMMDGEGWTTNGVEDVDLPIFDDERERSSPNANALRGQVVPPLDLTSLHVNTDGHAEAVLAWSSQPVVSKGGGGGGGEGHGEVQEESSQSAGRLDKHQKITSLLHDPYDAPLSPRAKDAPPTFGSGSWELEGPPSPVSQHDMFSRSSKRSDSALDADDHSAVIKQLSRQVRSLKQKIRQYEEEFERQYHAKPSQTEKNSQPEIRKMIGELKRATKQLKALKSEAKEMKTPLHSTLPARLGSGEQREEEEPVVPPHLAGLKEALNLAQQRLQDKRTDANRAYSLHEMSGEEVKEEKVAIQKALLQLESKYGRPTSRASKEVMKPLYDRYRTLKKLIKNKEVRKSVSEDLTQSDLNTIEEHEETRDFIPKQLGPVHSRYDPDQADDEDEDDMFTTTDFRVTQMISPGQRSSDQEDICLSPNDSGRNESPFSPSSASFHEATFEELVLRQDQAQNEKRRLRRVLKDFEENFLRETGQRVQKEDRSPMDIEYNQYKHIKKQLKLLNALIAKHQSQTSAAVT